MHFWVLIKAKLKSIKAKSLGHSQVKAIPVTFCDNILGCPRNKHLCMLTCRIEFQVPHTRERLQFLCTVLLSYSPYFKLNHTCLSDGHISRLES